MNTLNTRVAESHKRHHDRGRIVPFGEFLIDLMEGAKKEDKGEESDSPRRRRALKRDRPSRLKKR